MLKKQPIIMSGVMTTTVMYVQSYCHINKGPYNRRSGCDLPRDLKGTDEVDGAPTTASPPLHIFQHAESGQGAVSEWTADVGQEWVEGRRLAHRPRRLSRPFHSPVLPHQYRLRASRSQTFCAINGLLNSRGGSSRRLEMCGLCDVLRTKVGQC